MMANTSNFLATSTALPRQQDGGENTAALGARAQQLREQATVSCFAFVFKFIVKPA